MIGLTDTGLARVMIAATAIPPQKRSMWLLEVVTRLERRKRDALNARRYRCRHRAGQVVLEVTVNAERLVDLLVAQRYLIDGIAHDRGTLQHALAKFVDDAARENNSSSMSPRYGEWAYDEA
jgi:hypothetical protein